MALGAALVVVCIFFIDRPVERLVAAHRGLLPLFQAMATPSLLPLPLAGLYLCLAASRRLAGHAAWAGSHIYLAASLATLAATAAKDELKWLFGRPWPESWMNYGVYAFHPLATFWWYGGFPSGHTAYITGPLGVLWQLVPRFRPLWAALILLVMIGLVGAGYHFVGDVIAGFLTGLAAAWGTLLLLPEPRRA